MIEFHAHLRGLHVGLVVTSGTLFALRGLLVLAGRQRIALATPLRLLSVAIDTMLLAAGLALLAILPGALFANGWLATKLVLLVAYVVLGTFALKRGRSARARTACYLAALAVYLFIASVARAHHPAGIFWLLGA